MPARALLFQCGACRSLVSADSVVLDQGQDRAGLSCAVCQAVTWLPLSRGALAPSPSLTAPVTAGVIDDDQRARVCKRLLALGPSGSSQEDLASSFERLLGHWHSDVEHKHFLNKASMLGELAFAGQRYRAMLEEVPDEPHAKRAQEDLVALAVAAMSRDAISPGPGGIHKGAVAVAMLLVTALICGAVAIFLPRLLR